MGSKANCVNNKVSGCFRDCGRYPVSPQFCQLNLSNVIGTLLTHQEKISVSDLLMIRRVKWRGTPVVPVRRGVLVTPAEAQWIIQRATADATSEFLRMSEGHACRARRNGMCDRTLCSGHDNRVPANGGAEKQVSSRRGYQLEFAVRTWPPETKTHAALIIDVKCLRCIMVSCRSVKPIFADLDRASGGRLPV
jgi:hypothetical protein